MHDQLLGPITVGQWSLPNRVFMAPLTRCRAGPDDVPQALNAEYYAQRSSAGLIVGEAAQISMQGRGYPHTPGIYTPAQISGWRLVTDAVHRAGGHIVCQLWHVGRISHPDFQPSGAAPVAPSVVTPPGTKRVYGDVQKPFVPPRALGADEIPGIVHDFAHAARSAIDAGFDGVEIHGANGYLLDQFLRTGTNLRTDDWGGPVANRARLHLEVTAAVCEAIGSQRVGIRVSPSGGSSDRHDADPHDTFAYLIEHLNQFNLAFLHVLRCLDGDAAAGSSEVKISFLRPLFENTFIANGLYTPEEARAEIARGHADAIAFGRLFIANPDLPARIAQGGPYNTPDPASFYGTGPRGYTDYPRLSQA